MRTEKSSSPSPSNDKTPATSRTLINLFEDSCKRFGSNPVFWEKTGTVYESVSYEEMREQVLNFACALMESGIRKGDRIALLDQARKDWVASELGILYAGAISVPLSVKLEPAEVMFRLKHSGARVLITSIYQYQKIRETIGELPALDKIILFDEQDQYRENERSFADLLNMGSQFLMKRREEYEAKFRSIQEDDCALISYTSGTTADPKGIMLSHKNLFVNTEQSLKMFRVEEDYRILLILPLDHSFAHTTGMYVFIASGASLASVQLGRTPAASLKNVFTNIREIRPDALLSVPTVAKNLRKNIENGIRKRGAFAEKIFRIGLQAAYKYNGEGWNRGRGDRIIYRPLYKIADKLVFSKVRENFGGKLKYFVGGGALLDQELQRFFLAIGIPMYQGYGLSEASPVISSNTVEYHKIGSSGKIVPNLEVKILDEKGNPLPAGQKGEIVVKGENVMIGYYRNETATLETIREGWLHTGDMGYFDRDGFLYVLGRFKSLLIGDDGEKYSPEGIEEFIEEKSGVIQQIMIYNNQDPYTTALIYPDIKALRGQAHMGEAQPAAEELGRRVIERIREEIDSFRNGNGEGKFPSRWLPATFAILEEGFTEENHFLNSTMKMVRGRIAGHYMDRIRYMYTPEGKDVANPQNLETILRLLNSEAKRC